MVALLKNIYQFYRYDCCWPYSVSFFLVLIIYWLDFFIVNISNHWVSMVSYGVIFAYYLYNVFLSAKGRIKAGDKIFFIVFLSSKIIIWGFMLALLMTWDK